MTDFQRNDVVRITTPGRARQTIRVERVSNGSLGTILWGREVVQRDGAWVPRGRGQGSAQGDRPFALTGRQAEVIR